MALKIESDITSKKHKNAKRTITKRQVTEISNEPTEEQKEIALKLMNEDEAFPIRRTRKTTQVIKQLETKVINKQSTRKTVKQTRRTPQKTINEIDTQNELNQTEENPRRVTRRSQQLAEEKAFEEEIENFMDMKMKGGIKSFQKFMNGRKQSISN